MTREIVTVLMLGTVTGLQAALLAIGIVLVYQAQRFLNFAQAQLGLVAASAFGVLVLRFDLPYGIALPLGLGAGVGAAVGLQWLLAWRLADASPTTLVIATIGASQVLLVATLEGPLAIDAGTLAVEGYPIPFQVSIDVGGYTLNTSEILTLTVGPLLVAALALFITRTRIGTSIRGIASNREAAELAGISVRRTAMLAWGIAGLISSVAAVLAAPSRPPGGLASAGTGLLLLGIVAAIAGGLSSFPKALAAGLAVGLLQQGVLFWVDIPGSSSVAVFLFLAIVLVRRSGRLPSRADVLAVGRRATNHGKILPEWIGTATWASLGLFFLALPFVPGLQTQEKALFLGLIVVYAITGMSIVVLTGWAGQVTLGQFAFVGVGAYTAARFSELGLSAPIVLLNAGFVTAAVTVVVGLPTLRLGRFFTAIITLGFAFVAQSWLFRQRWFTGNDTGYMVVDDPHVFSWQLDSARKVYVGAVVVAGLVALLLANVRRSSFGRSILAVRDNESRLSSDGVSPTRIKVLAISLSGFVAGVAGGLWAMVTRQWSFDSFEPSTSLVMLSLTIVGSLSMLSGPVVGALAVFSWPFLVPGANTIVVRSLTSGALLFVVLLFAPDGIAGSVRSQLASRFGQHPTSSRKYLPLSLDRPRRPLETVPVRLECTGVTKRFGGIVAVSEVDFHVEHGEIVGLIGGNGAGKSTLLDCLAGRTLADAGRVELDGLEVTHWAPYRRAGAGLARTYQDAALFSGLTLRETLLVALDRGGAGTVSSAVAAPWVRLAELESRAEVDEVLERYGLLEAADRRAGELSTGMRRVAEIAAAVISAPGLILLDEPTAGLAQREVEALRHHLVELRDRYGASVVIVEHDIPMLVDLSDRMYCMAEGQVIASGSPADVIADPQVIATCLGTDVAAIQRSGTVGERDETVSIGGAR